MPGPGGIDVDVELLARRNRAPESLEQAGQQPPVRTPDALRTQFHDAVDAVEGSQQLELTIERQDRRTETHFLQTSRMRFGKLDGNDPECNCFRGCWRLSLRR